MGASYYWDILPVQARIVSHHNFTHSAMEAQSVYVQLKNLLDGNNWEKMYLHSLIFFLSGPDVSYIWSKISRDVATGDVGV
jgi:hypothetical protein